MWSAVRVSGGVSTAVIDPMLPLELPRLSMGPWPPPMPAPAETRVSVTSGSLRRSAAMRSRIVVIAARPVPSGARTLIDSFERSSSGAKFFPMAAKSGTMLAVTSTHSVTTAHRCAMDHRSIAM